jgi:integrase
MTDEEFRQLLRHSDADFRRVLIWLHATGCRPGELLALRWRHVHLARGVVLLDQHKTLKKTGRPRVIALAPAAVKLLAWIQRSRFLTLRQAAARCGLNRQTLSVAARSGFLRVAARRRDGELTLFREADVAELAGLVTPAGAALLAGLSVRQVVAAVRIGRLRAVCLCPHLIRREDLAAFLGRPVPAAAECTTRTPDGEARVFTTYYAKPWTMAALSWRLRAARARAGLAADVCLYGCRHAFAVRGVLANVNLRTLATLLGHAHTSTTEHYLHEAGQVEHLREAVATIAGMNGRKAGGP